MDPDGCEIFLWSDWGFTVEALKHLCFLCDFLHCCANANVPCLTWLNSHYSLHQLHRRENVFESDVKSVSVIHHVMASGCVWTTVDMRAELFGVSEDTRDQDNKQTSAVPLSWFLPDADCVSNRRSEASRGAAQKKRVPHRLFVSFQHVDQHFPELWPALFLMKESECEYHLEKFHSCREEGVKTLCVSPVGGGTRGDGGRAVPPFFYW